MKIPGWYRQAAEVMARNGVGLKQACLEIDKDLTLAECDVVGRRKEFQEVLQEEEDKYRISLADRPSRSKSVAIGIMIESIDKLYKQGEYAQAASAVEKLAKLEGWVGGDSNVNIFQGITAKDIEKARKEIESQIAKEPDAEKESLPN